MPTSAASEGYSAPRAEWAELAGFSDEVVCARTGRSWAEWVAALDAAGAQGMEHRDIARHVHERYEGVSGWWAQAVTVGYERIRGLRDVGQRRSGTFEANRSRTFPVDVETLYAMFADGRRRARWLPAGGGGAAAVRASTPLKSVRMDWHDGTQVQCWFEAKGAAKSRVSVAHTKLAGKEQLELARTFWDERLTALRELLDRRGS